MKHVGTKHRLTQDSKDLSMVLVGSYRSMLFQLEALRSRRVILPHIFPQSQAVKSPPTDPLSGEAVTGASVFDLRRGRHSGRHLLRTWVVQVYTCAACFFLGHVWSYVLGYEGTVSRGQGRSLGPKSFNKRPLRHGQTSILLGARTIS